MFCCFGEKRKKQKEDEIVTQKQVKITQKKPKETATAPYQAQKQQKIEPIERKSIDDPALISHKNVYIVNEREELHLRVKNPSSKNLLKKASESLQIQFIPDRDHKA